MHNNEVHLDIAEREAKILVSRGDNWQPAPPPAAEPAVESAPTAESTSAPQAQQPTDPVNQTPPSNTPSQ